MSGKRDADSLLLSLRPVLAHLSERRSFSVTASLIVTHIASTLIIEHSILKRI